MKESKEKDHMSEGPDKDKVTNEEILVFFAGRDGGDCEVTREYLKFHDPDSSGGYIALAEVFRNGGVVPSKGDPRDGEFYTWLHDMPEDERRELASLRELLKRDKDFDVFLEKTKGDRSWKRNPLLQKWHLFVSWYAYREYLTRDTKRPFNSKKELENDARNGPNGTLKGSITCREMMIWMAEAAAGPDVAKKHLKALGTAELHEWAGAVKKDIIDAVNRDPKIREMREEKERKNGT